MDPKIPQPTPLQESSKSIEVVLSDLDPVVDKIGEREIAYTVKDKSFEFVVQKSLNAWWMEAEKVRDLIACFKNGFEVKDALCYAGVTRGQWQYFNEIHPEFSAVMEICENIAFQLAEKNNIEGLKSGDLPHTRWFLQTRRPEKYTRPDALPSGPPINQNFGTIINNKIDAGALSPNALRIIESQPNGSTTSTK